MRVAILKFLIVIPYTVDFKGNVFPVTPRQKTTTIINRSKLLIIMFVLPVNVRTLVVNILNTRRHYPKEITN